MYKKIAKVSNIFEHKTLQRSECPIHRFSVSRQSFGGISSINPNNLRWLYETAESWPWGNSINMDFMHQSAMIYSRCLISSELDRLKCSSVL